MLKLARSILKAAISIVTPPECCVCGLGLFNDGSPVCDSCQTRLNLYKGERCQKCGVALPEGAASICPECRTKKSSLAFVVAVGPYEEPLSEMILALKFKRLTAVAPKLSEMLADVLWEDGRVGSDWVLVPVPLSAMSGRRRGFNQSELIASGLSKSLGVPLLTNALSKVRETREQASLSRLYRLSNLTGAFRAEEKAVQGRKILLVDDITTTGSTLEACAKELRRTGASKVAAAVIAHTPADRKAALAPDDDKGQ
jgi:ComF family protein